MRALAPEEQSLFFEYARGHWFYELLAFCVSTGCRIGEAGALLWKDIDFENQEILIYKTMAKSGSSTWYVGSAKTKSGTRKLPLSDNTRRILASQKAKIAEHFGIAYVKPNMPVFRSLLTDHPVVSYHADSAIASVLRDIEKDGKHIDHFSVHALRDTFATRFIEQGGSMDTLRDILGHKSITITMSRYAAVLPHRMRSEMDRVEIVI